LPGAIDGQHAVLEREHFDGAGVFRLPAGGVVAARHQERGPVRWRGADLVGVDAGVRLCRLVHQIAERAVLVDVMHRDIARVVIGDERVFAGSVDADVNGARGQLPHRPVRGERAAGRIDAEGARDMGIAFARIPAAGLPIAGDNIKVAPRRMRPGVLHIGWKNDRAPPDEYGCVHVKLIQRELRPDAGIVNGLSLRHLSPGFLRSGNATGNERSKGAAIDHGWPPESAVSFETRRSVSAPLNHYRHGCGQRKAGLSKTHYGQDGALNFARIAKSPDFLWLGEDKP
jgi:hypothetical protein